MQKQVYVDVIIKYANSLTWFRNCVIKLTCFYICFFILKILYGLYGVVWLLFTEVNNRATAPSVASGSVIGTKTRVSLF